MSTAQTVCWKSLRCVCLCVSPSILISHRPPLPLQALSKLRAFSLLARDPQNPKAKQFIVSSLSFSHTHTYERTHTHTHTHFRTHISSHPLQALATLLSTGRAVFRLVGIPQMIGALALVKDTDSLSLTLKYLKIVSILLYYPFEVCVCVCVCDCVFVF